MSSYSRIKFTDAYQRIVLLLLADRTVQELAEEIGVSRQTVHSWRNGIEPRRGHRDWLVEKAVEMLERARENGR